MDGILNVLKPPDMTSFDVVAYLRGVTKTKKIGHTGTLDPAAVGVLPICMGRATKAIDFLMDKDKLYRAELTLGVDTDTQDACGSVVRTRKVTGSPSEISDVIHNFLGKQQQIPPMYSAIKVDGKKLYELARKGVTIERTPREITIYSIHIIKIMGHKVLFDVACSKGTYIRTLCSDIGEKLGCGGHMSFLIRMRAGNFDISEALSLEKIAELGKSNQLESVLEKVDKIFSEHPEVLLSDRDEKKFFSGIHLQVDQEYALDSLIRVYNAKGIFVALGEIFFKGDLPFLKIKKSFA